MKIGERGQVTIPKSLREKYGLYPEIEVEFIPEEDGIKLQKKMFSTSPMKKVYGVLKKGTSTDKYIEEIRGK